MNHSSWVRNGAAFAGICFGLLACGKTPETKGFAYDRKTRGSGGTLMIWHENHSKSILTLESRASINGENQRIGGTFTFPPEGNVGFTDFGNEAWRDSMPFDAYSIRLMRMDRDGKAGGDQWLLDIPLSKAELNAYRGKDLQLHFHDSYVIVKKRGFESKLGYKPSPIPKDM